MQLLNILLLNLPTGLWYKDKLAASNSMPPLGLLYIASSLSKHNYNVKIIDFAVESYSVSDLKGYIESYKPAIIGMSTYNESWNTQQVLCNMIKKEFPKITIVAGGAFATFCYKDILSNSKTDYVLCGEGENIFLEFCNHYFSGENFEEKVKEIKGISYIDAYGAIQQKGMPDRIQDLDSLAIPDRSLIKIEKYVLPYTISTSRGCPGKCIFCSSKAFWGKDIVLRSALNIFQEIMHLYTEFGTQIFYITDDTFTISSKRCEEFCELLQVSGIRFTWGCESRADIINEDMIKMMSEAGCHKIQFGFESADNEILSKLKKNVTIEQIENAIKLAYKYNMHIQASYIVGHAFDTEETIEKTLKFAEYLRDTYGARVVCSVNTPFPGTEQYDKSEKYGIKINTKDWSQYVLNTPIISTKYVSTNKLRYYLEQGQHLTF